MLTDSRPAGLTALLLVLLAASPARAQVVEYYHTDAIGNVRAITDASGNVIERHDYQPYGEEWLPQGGTQPLRFTGKERDAETGLDYFGARYYGSKIGRFTTTDPVYTWQENLADPQRWNRYAYARNNPLRYVDPDGRAVWDTVGGWVNAVGSNFFLGLGRTDPYHPDFAQGQAMGDKFSLGLSVVEMSIAAGGGAVLALPSGGTVAIPAAGVAAHSAVQAAAATFNLSKNNASGSGPKGADAPGTTAGGQATDAYGNKLGPSGKPMVHETESTTREAARNKALSEGAGAANHSNPARGRPHFHPADANGAKKPNSTHHNYPE